MNKRTFRRRQSANPDRLLLVVFRTELIAEESSRRMGIEALYRRPRTTTPEPGHKICPYLLRGMAIERPNQVWAMDITFA